MKDYKEIGKAEVWAHLQLGVKVFAAVLKSSRFNTGIYNLQNWNVEQILHILSDKELNVSFYVHEDADERNEEDIDIPMPCDSFLMRRFLETK